MGRIKLGFRLCLFSLCVFVLALIKAEADSNENSTSPIPNPNPNVAQDSELPVSLVLDRLDAMEQRFLEEMNRQFKSSQKNWDDQFKSLKKELDDMKNENSVGEDVWLLTPPLRGRRGGKGEKGDSQGFRGSHSMSFRPSAPVPLKTNSGKEMQWEIERPGENWIVAKGISRWEPNGRWGDAELCPPGKFVTGHKFTYFSHSGLTEVELTCTNKYKTEEREIDHILRLKSADEPEINVIREEWDIRNRGNRTNFAQGFSLNRRLLERRGSAPEIRKMAKNYDLIYHDQNPEESALNSSFSGIVTKCPENHAICGLIPMMDAAGFGILSAVGFKCCSICTPVEKWVTVHQFNNTESSNETVEFNTTVGLQQRPTKLKSSSILNSTNFNSLESAVNSVGISSSDFYQEVSTHLAKSNFTGFNWTAAAVSMGTEETNLTKTFTCKANSSCVYKQLVGQCGNTRIPVDKFCNVSGPIGSSIPEHCPESGFKSCSVVMKHFLPSFPSTQQWIYPHGNNSGNGTSLKVLCDFETDGGGWTIIQKRSSGPKHDFDRTWKEYAEGFGSLDRNFWIGLENIHALTQNGDQELRIDLEDFEGNKKWAKYSRFSVSDASDKYRLSISGFFANSTLRDSMANPGESHNILHGMKFSTKHEDNDKNSRGNCLDSRGGGGGWWFNACGDSNLNGLYFKKGETTDEYHGIWWYSWKRHSSLAKSEMKIRTRK